MAGKASAKVKARVRGKTSTRKHKCAALENGNGNHRGITEVTLIPGDGIGPEVMAAAVKVIEAGGVRVKWDIQQAGAAALKLYDDPVRRLY